MSDNEEESQRRVDDSQHSPTNSSPSCVPKAHNLATDKTPVSEYNNKISQPTSIVKESQNRSRISVSTNLTSQETDSKSYNKPISRRGTSPCEVNKTTNAMKSPEKNEVLASSSTLKDKEQVDRLRYKSSLEYNNYRFNSEHSVHQNNFADKRHSSYNGIHNNHSEVMGKDAINTILHNYVNNQVEINKIINERTNFISNGSFSSINNLINRVNNISSMNGVNNVGHLLSPRILSPKDTIGYHPLTPLNNSTGISSHHSSPSMFSNNNLSTSMMTLSPPHTLSPHNRSNNMSLSSLSASPQDDGVDEGEEADDENETIYKNSGNFVRKNRKLNELYSSPSSFGRSFFNGQTSPPLTPLSNNNNNDINTNEKKVTKLDISPVPTSNLPSKLSHQNGSRLSIPGFFGATSSPSIEPVSMFNHSMNKSMFHRSSRSDNYKPEVNDSMEIGLDINSSFRNSSKQSLIGSPDSKNMVPDTTMKNEFTPHYPEVPPHMVPNVSNSGAPTSSELTAATERFITQQLSAAPPELQILETTTEEKVNTLNKLDYFNLYKQEDSQSERDSKPFQLDSTMNGSMNSEQEKSDSSSWTEGSSRNNLVAANSDLKLGVFAKQLVAKGTRYGPFLGKWVSVARDPSFAWEVSTHITITFMTADFHDTFHYQNGIIL